MFLSLTRDVATGEYCLGTLIVGALTFETLELPWIADPIGKGGQQGVSCVPPGLYELVRHDTPKHPKSFALVNPALDVYHEPGDVPPEKQGFARTAVLLHVANSIRDLQGCIGVGMERGEGCILQSRKAIDRFSLIVPWIVGHSLEIAIAQGLATSTAFSGSSPL